MGPHRTRRADADHYSKIKVQKEKKPRKEGKGKTATKTKRALEWWEKTPPPRGADEPDASAVDDAAASLFAGPSSAEGESILTRVSSEDQRVVAHARDLAYRTRSHVPPSQPGSAEEGAPEVSAFEMLVEGAEHQLWVESREGEAMARIMAGLYVAFLERTAWWLRASPATCERAFRLLATRAVPLAEALHDQALVQLVLETKYAFVLCVAQREDGAGERVEVWEARWGKRWDARRAELVALAQSMKGARGFVRRQVRPPKTAPATPIQPAAARRAESPEMAVFSTPKKNVTLQNDSDRASVAQQSRHHMSPSRKRSKKDQQRTPDNEGALDPTFNPAATWQHQVPRKSKRRAYKCGLCGEPKAGHVCSALPSDPLNFHTID